MNVREVWEIAKLIVGTLLIVAFVLWQVAYYAMAEDCDRGETNWLCEP